MPNGAITIHIDECIVNSKCLLHPAGRATAFEPLTKVFREKTHLKHISLKNNAAQLYFISGIAELLCICTQYNVRSAIFCNGS